MVNDKANVKITLNSQEAENQLKELQTEMKKLVELKKKASAAGDLKGYKQIDKELKKVTRTASQLIRDHKNLDATIRNLSGASIKELREAQRSLTSQTDKLNRKTGEYIQKKAQLKLVRAEITRINNEYRTQQSLSSRLVNGFNKYFTTITAGIAAFAGIIIGLKKMKTTIDTFEESITNVYTLLDDADFDKFKNILDEGSIDLIKRYGFEINDVNKALFDTISAGIPAGNSIKFMNEAAILSKGGVTSLATSVDGMTSILNAYGIEMDRSNEVSSAFFTAQKYGKTTVAELASNVGKTVPIAAQAGISYRELLASVAALTTQGISTDMAMTSMKNAIQSVLKPGKAAEEVLRKFGVPIGATEVRAKGLGYTLEKLNAVMLKNPDAVSKAIPNIRGLTAVSALSGRGLEKYRQILAKVNEDFGQSSSLMSAYNKQMETDVQKMQTAIGKRKASIVEMGKELGPFFVSMIRLSTWSTRALLKLVKAIVTNKKAILILGSATLAYVTYLKLAANWTKIYAFYTASIAVASKTYAYATGVLSGKIKLATVRQHAWNLAQKANPIGLIVGILVGAGVALEAYIKKINSLSASQKVLNDIETRSQQNIVEEKLKVEELLETAKNQILSIEKRKLALSELNRISPEYFGNLTLEKINSEEATMATEAYTLSLLKQARVEAAREKLIELEKQRIDAVQNGTDYQNKWYQTAWSGVKSLGNAQAFAMQQAVSGSKNALKAEQDYATQKEVLIELINTQSKALENQATTGSISDVNPEMGVNTPLSELDEMLLKDHEKQKQAIEDYFYTVGEGAFDSFMAAIEKKQKERKSLLDLIDKIQQDESEIEFSPEADYELQNYQQTLDYKKVLLAAQHQHGLIGEKEYQDKLTELNKKATDERHKINIKKADDALHFAEMGSNFVMSLMDLELAKAGDNEEKQKQIKKKYADLNFAVTTAQIIASTAGAIMQGYAQLGPIGGTISAIILGATGLVQLGIANAERQKVKGYAKGKYPILADDGKWYDTSFSGQPKTGFYNGPQLGVFNEVPGQPEMVVDGITTRQLQINYPHILRAIYDVRDRKIPQYADGKYPSAPQKVGLGTGSVSPQPGEKTYLDTHSMENLTKAINQLLLWKPAIGVDTITKKINEYNDIQNKRGL